MKALIARRNCQCGVWEGVGGGRSPPGKSLKNNLMTKYFIYWVRSRSVNCKTNKSKRIIAEKQNETVFHTMEHFMKPVGVVPDWLG